MLATKLPPIHANRLIDIMGTIPGISANVNNILAIDIESQDIQGDRIDDHFLNYLIGCFPITNLGLIPIRVKSKDRENV